MRKGRPELIGRYGSTARRWLGDKAGYVAKHLWINKHYGKAYYCENNSSHIAKRYCWANISGNYKREREDYKQLCTSCNVRESKKDYCKNGHHFTKENTYIRPEGWRACRTCYKLASQKYHGKIN